MNVGDVAPNFILKDESGKDFELYKNLDTKILLVFYPKDDTPVCSTQLSEYNDNFDEFIQNGIKVLGINAGTVQSHLDFCNKLNIKFPLLADKDKIVSKQYDAINFLGMNKRLIVIIGTDRKVLWTASSLPVTFIKTKEIVEKVKSLTVKK
ncbi:MAG: peroxiredoxin [Ignavibacteria bacterium]|nr:peroxiredoxin [Ignavibacteria bacterium]